MNSAGWWSVFLGVVALSRAASHWIHPPAEIRASSIEGALTYDTWAVIFAIIGVLILAGVAGRLPVAVWSGHVLGTMAYGAVCVSYLLSAFSGAQWSGVGSMAVVVALHAARVMHLGGVVTESPRSRKRI